MSNLFRSISTICFCSILVLSCKKDKDDKKDVEPVDPCDQIVKVISINPYGNSQLTATLTYDEKGRITHVKGQGKNESAYTYYKDSIVLKATDIHGDDIGVTYYLDANGRVKGTSFYDNLYKYNAGGYLISYRQPYSYNNQIVDYADYTLTYANGDLVELFTAKPNVSYKKVNFKYYDEPNQQLLGYNQPLYVGGVLGDRNSFYLIGAGFFGKQSTHLFKTLGFNDSWNNSNVNYTKDAKGRVISTSAFGFEYQCP